MTMFVPLTIESSLSIYGYIQWTYSYPLQRTYLQRSRARLRVPKRQRSRIVMSVTKPVELVRLTGFDWLGWR